LIDVNNIHGGVINNVINYLRKYVNDGGGEWHTLTKSSQRHYNYDGTR
jgi:hypothetical protein